MHQQPVSFPEWQEVLARAPLDEQMRESYRWEVIGFLRHCKSRHEPATASLAKAYVEAREGQVSAPVREALRWWFVAARRRAVRSSVEDGGVVRVEAVRGQASRRSSATPPPLAATDLGGEAWEQALIREIRRRGFLWRTEQTYREWAARFARFLAPRSPFAAEAADVGAFLTEVAVRQRASPSTQKQALNALVFLLEEGLSIKLGKIDFQRARPKQRLPSVLSEAECERLFMQLEGTTRLMAELMYGSGLRLMELLRLRVHHLDFERERLQVLGGKGDKDRLTVLSRRLVPALQGHLDRLRELWKTDRANRAPGVWLPEGLARKYPKAGESWE